MTESNDFCNFNMIEQSNLSMIQNSLGQTPGNIFSDQKQIEQSKPSTIQNNFGLTTKNFFSNKNQIEYFNNKDIPQQKELDSLKESIVSIAANASQNIKGLRYLNEKDLQKNLNNGIIEENKKQNKKIFNIKKMKKKVKRDFGNYRARFRTPIMKFYIRILKDAKIKSNLPKYLKKYEIKKPNHKDFTVKLDSSKVRKELDQSMKDILCGPYLEIGEHNHKEEKQNQRDNKKRIEQIEEYYKENPSKSVKEILELINMKYRRVIEILYDPKELKEFKDFQVFEKLKDVKEFEELIAFKSQKNNKDDDKRFKKRYGYSLFDKNGFIRYYEEKLKAEEEKGQNEKEQNKKMIGRKRKSDEE